MLPSLESLHCFAEAARLLNFRAAAHVVALTPAALGQRIRQLEEQLGAPLFHRTTRKVVLTQAGLALVPYARRALEAAEDCVRAGRGDIGPTPVDLTVGTRHELGMSWLVPMLPRLRAAQPGLTVHLYFGSSADLTIRVRNLEIDCAIGSMRLGDPRLESIRLHREDYMFVGSPRLLRKKPLKRDSDAAGHTLIDSTASMSLFGYFRSAPGGGDRLRFGKVLAMGTIAAIRALVLEGEGVAVLPAYLVDPDLRARRLVSVFPTVKLVSDWFRLVFRADDPRRSVYESLAVTLSREPLK
jgi:LysR family transcriptional regulator, glycine cleavage system transcriptional activator